MTILETMAVMAQEILDGTWQPSKAATNHLGLLPITAEDIELDMHTWVVDRSHNSDTPCGTAACIVGHAMLDDRLYQDLTTEGRSVAPRYGYMDQIAAELVSDEDLKALATRSALDTCDSLLDDFKEYLETYLFMPSAYDLSRADGLPRREFILKEFIKRVELIMKTPPSDRPMLLARVGWTSEDADDV